jgi:hypothetical protein
MDIKYVLLSELSEPVRAFLTQAGEGGGLLVKDDKGRLCYRIVLYSEATPEEKEQAWENLRRLQDHVAESMREQGITKDDVDRFLADSTEPRPKGD